jgi:hypothetical protein
MRGRKRHRKKLSKSANAFLQRFVQIMPRPTLMELRHGTPPYSWNAPRDREADAREFVSAIWNRFPA